MLLLSVELENIKRYSQAAFAFPEGIVAIVGSNGAGKTTILEAVGFAIFDHLPYPQSDFIRRGQKSGTVKVTFRSGMDDRTYTVVRTCQGQYYVYDPELKQKPVEQKADVQRWLKAHLGLAPTTDLANLFVTAVGVPQGTFTADFLKTPTARKKVFDPLLRVESYKEASDSLAETSRVLQTERGAIDRQVAGAQARLSDLGPSQSKVAEVHLEQRQTALQLDSLTAERSVLSESVGRLDQQVTAIDGLRQQVALSEEGLRHLDQQVKQQHEQIRQAESAAAIVATHTVDHATYLAAQGAIALLEPQLVARATQAREKQVQEGQHVKFTTLLEGLKVQLTELRAAAQEREALTPVLTAWQALEGVGLRLQEQDRLRQATSQQHLRAAQQQATLTARHITMAAEVAALAPHAALAALVPERQTALQTAQLAMQQIQQTEAALLQCDQQHQAVQRGVADFQDKQQRVHQETGRLQALLPVARTLPTHQTALAEQLHAVGAAQATATSLDEWRGKLAGGMCPFLANRCLNLAEGQSLDEALTKTLTEAQGQIAVAEGEVAGLQVLVRDAQAAVTATAGMVELQRQSLELGQALATQLQLLGETEASRQVLLTQLGQCDTVATALHTAESALTEAQQAALAAAKVAGLRALGQELSQQIAVLDGEIALHLTTLATMTDLDGQLAAHAQQLARTTDPRPRVHGLDDRLKERPELEQRVVKGEALVTQVTATLTLIDSALAETEGLMAAMTGERERLERHQAGYQQVLQHQVLAQALPGLQVEAAALGQRVTEVQSSLQVQSDQLTAQQGTYDAAAHLTSRERLQRVLADLERLGERQRNLTEQATELETRIRQLQDLQVQSEEWLLAESELDRIAEFLDVGRSALREAGPKLTQAYLTSISSEANRLYREITGLGWVDLRWADDYEVVLNENGLDRSFATLSGGEQMAAALAVRLALLKEVSSLDIAFFDEPTTNLDEERRRNLAKQLPQVRGFRQLIVISHDDTFEEVTDHLLRVDEQAD
ncbi:MAG: SMC family ATPase [Candidatus Sericytochromatia bacterium]|nr:SMC family ATPase [Candidatus Sericytochromatia bacterium]